MAAVHLSPFIMTVKVQTGAPVHFDQFAVADDVHIVMVWRQVAQRFYVFFESRTDKVPYRTAHHARILVEIVPVFIHSAAAIARYGEVFIKEGRSDRYGITACNQSHLQFMFQRKRVTRTDDVLGRMRESIAAVHPVSGGVQ